LFTSKTEAFSSKMEKLVMLPGPTNVPQSVMLSMAKPIINHRSTAFSHLYKRVVGMAKQVFGTEEDVIIFSSSGTGGVEAAVINLIRKGDTVVVPVFGEFSSRVADTVETYGGIAVRVESPYGCHPTLEQIEEALEKVKTPKALILVYNETSTGVTFRSMEKLAALVHKTGAYFVVDAVSILGGDDLPVDRWGVDMCITGSQKCLAAPPGLSLVSVSHQVKDFLRRSPPAADYFDIPKHLKYMERWETPYTPSLPLFYALDEALRIVLEEGLRNRIRRHSVCATAFYSAFSSIDIEPFPGPQFRSNTVIAVNYPSGVDDKIFRTTLDEKFGILVSGGFGNMRGRVFRIGCMGEISAYHVLRTVDAVVSTLGLMGVQVEPKKALSAANEQLSSL
jgi:aspartate aminotransferase-like enzyme